MYQTIVIGGGPSGAMAAVAASEKILKKWSTQIQRI